MLIKMYEDNKKSKELEIGDKIYYGFSCFQAFGEVKKIKSKSVVANMCEFCTGNKWFVVDIRNTKGINVISEENYQKYVKEEIQTEKEYYDSLGNCNE